MKKNKKKKKTTIDYLSKIRNSWNGINPVTRVVPDKTKYSRKQKHKKDYSLDN